MADEIDDALAGPLPNVLERIAGLARDLTWYCEDLKIRWPPVISRCEKVGLGRYRSSIETNGPPAPDALPTAHQDWFVAREDRVKAIDGRRKRFVFTAEREAWERLSTNLRGWCRWCNRVIDQADWTIHIDNNDNGGLGSSVAVRELFTLPPLVSSGEVAQPADIDGKASPPAPESGYLGLVVDEARGEVRRAGHNRGNAVTFDVDAADWHTFLTAWRAGEQGATDAQWRTGYPGDWSQRRKRKSAASDKLSVLNICFEGGYLKLTEMVMRPA